MTFTDFEKDPNHITFDFIKYYYSKLSLDSSKLYQLYSPTAVIKHSESTKTHDYNTPDSIKKYWKTNSFLSNSKIIILTVNTVENSDTSLVATVVGEILLEQDYSLCTNDDIIPTRPFTQTFVLEKEEDKDAYMIKSDILTFIPDTDYEKAQLIDNTDIELVDETKQDNIKNNTEKAKTEEPNGHTEKAKVQQEVVEKKVESVKQQPVPEVSKDIPEKSTINKVSSEKKADLTPLPASNNSERTALTAPGTPNSSNATVKSLQSDSSDTTATTTTDIKPSITVSQSQSAPATPPSGTTTKHTTTDPKVTEKPAIIQGSWASAIKTSTSTNASPASVSHATISTNLNNSKNSNDEPFTTVRSHSQNSNSGSNLNSNSNKKNTKTHPYEVFVQFKHAALPPKEKDLDEALRKKDYKGYKINVFKPINAIVAFTTKEEQARALEMKNILHKDVDYFIDVRTPKPKKKTYNNGGDKK